MILFNSDYTEGAHEKILQKMLETNMEQTVGYGCDMHCEHARELIQKACGRENAQVHFLVGGTQTNTTVIAAALRPYEGVIAASTGHIGVHETGAIEATGHKVLSLPEKDGKITAQQIAQCFDAHVADDSFEHMVRPGMVYISQPTEVGTIYSKEELTQIAQVCRERDLWLFVDGARLGYGLMAKDCDVTLEDLAALSDVFYIGGTKVGALFGEAVVICNEKLQPNFRYMIKQRGGMLAKGRLLGIQFETLFEDGLYWEISKHADQMADRIREVLDKQHISYLAENNTNQIFPILEDSFLAHLSKRFGFSYTERVDETRSAVRFCTSWATKESDVEELCQALSYCFNGWQTAGNVKVVNAIYPGIDTPLDLYDALSDIWCRETCAPRLRDKWTKENKTAGQCSITAFLAQDIFGGEVYAMPTDNGGVHCYNVINGYTFDLTSEQFKEEAKDLVYEGGMLQDRESPMHFLKEEKRARYEYIKKELSKK